MAAVTFFYCMVPTAVVARALPENPKEISWHISAAMVTYDNERQLYIAEDDVVVTGGATRLEADYVEFSNKTKDTFAQGNVLLLSGHPYHLLSYLYWHHLPLRPLMLSSTPASSFFSWSL